MKKALLLSPLIAAILFTIPESWQLMHQEDSNYIPVVFEVLLLIFGYLVAGALNSVVIVPVCLLLKLRNLKMLAGLVLSVTVALIGTTVAYAFEIFNYQSSILHPAYLYPVLIPLFVLTLTTYILLSRHESSPEHADVSESSDENDAK